MARPGLHSEKLAPAAVRRRVQGRRRGPDSGVARGAGGRRDRREAGDNKGHLVPLRTRGSKARWGDVDAWPGAYLAVTTASRQVPSLGPAWLQRETCGKGAIFRELVFT